MERNNDVQVIAWSEFTEPQSVYPTGIHGCLAEHLNNCQGITASVSGIEDSDQGVSEEQLESADVLIWFGHVKHGDVADTSVERIVKHVKENGLGFLGLHSTHFARPFKALMETECSFRAYVENGTKGVGEYSLTWDAANHSSGVYYIQIQNNNNVDTQKVVLLK